MDFSHQTVIVTGAAGNLGRGVAEVFAERGATLVLVGLHRTALVERFGDDDGRRLLMAADLRERHETQTVVERALERFGRVDVLCNVAGGFRMGEAVHETSDDTWRFLFDVNVRSVVNMAHAAVPAMLARGGGKIVNVAAAAGERGAARKGAYSAAKAAVIRLTEAMSDELRERNVNVNCVLPTTLDTPENRAAMPGVDPSRWVATGDLARVIAFLASADARAIHGASIPVRGLS
jgi:NAD(P)-dependent dehydrogenase (short-subunit alcohol dehydrogenase family)